MLQPNEQLKQQGYQVLDVDYNRADRLDFALMGIDTVISTIPGLAQINLIEAAARTHVRRFAPAEFEGSPTMRPVVDPLDLGRNKAACLQRLRHYGIQHTSFVCGVFYERFAPGGLGAQGVGFNTLLHREGDYVMDIRNLKAQIPYVNSLGGTVSICMTSMTDLARFVVQCLHMDAWPPELRICGERRTVLEVVQEAEHMSGAYLPPLVPSWNMLTVCLGRAFDKSYHSPSTLDIGLTNAIMQGDHPGMLRWQSLIATSLGRYDFDNPNFRGSTRFSDWLQAAWGRR